MKKSFPYPVIVILLMAFPALGASEGAEVVGAEVTDEASPPRPDSPTVEEADDPEARTEEHSVDDVGIAGGYPGRQVEGRVAAKTGIQHLTSDLGFTSVSYFYRMECPTGWAGDICRSAVRQIIYIMQPPPGMPVADAIQIPGVEPVYSYWPPVTGYRDGSVLPETLITWPVPAEDANYDLKVNILDMIFIRNRIGHDPASGDNWKADVISDGVIDILDMLLVRYYLNESFEGRTWHPYAYPW